MSMKWEKVEANIWRSTTEEKKYKVDLYYGRDDRGKMKRSSKVIKGTLTDARTLLKLHGADRVKKVVQAPTKKTLRQVFDDWERIGGGADNEETTKTSNENIERHILEYFGDIRINKITTTMVREYMAYLKDEKELSNNTINKHRTRLNTVFNYMLSVPEEYGLYNNPISKVKPYKVPKNKKTNTYTTEEAKELLLHLRKSNRHDLEVAINLAFWCGCRREETCGLKWKDIDFKNGIISFHDIRTTAKGKVIHREDMLKNGDNVKIVGMTPWLKMILENEYKYQQEMQNLYGNEYADEDFVFCHDNGRTWHPNSLSNEYKKYLVNNGFKVIRYHDLRHTNASMLLSMLGAVDVSKILGHSRPSTTTDIYGHVLGQVTDKGVDVLDKMMAM